MQRDGEQKASGRFEQQPPAGCSQLGLSDMGAIGSPPGSMEPIDGSEAIGASGAVGTEGGAIGLGRAATTDFGLTAGFAAGLAAGLAAFFGAARFGAALRATLRADRFFDEDFEALRRVRFAEAFFPRLLRRVVRRAFFFAAIANPLD